MTPLINDKLTTGRLGMLHLDEGYLALAFA
jgi:hypothetical protein